MLPQHVDIRESLFGGIDGCLSCISTTAGLPLSLFLGLPVSVQLVTDDGGLHTINGIIVDAREGESDNSLSTYQLFIRDALSILERRINTRIFRQLSVLDIVQTLVREWRQNSSVLAGAFYIDVSNVDRTRFQQESRRFSSMNPMRRSYGVYVGAKASAGLSRRQTRAKGVRQSGRHSAYAGALRQRDQAESIRGGFGRVSARCDDRQTRRHYVALCGEAAGARGDTPLQLGPQTRRNGSDPRIDACRSRRNGQRPGPIADGFAPRRPAYRRFVGALRPDRPPVPARAAHVDGASGVRISSSVNGSR